MNGHMQMMGGKKKFRVGIIGTGFIADLHADALKRVENTEVVGCCDIDRGRAESFARRWGLPGAYSDLKEFAEQARPDVAHVLVPPDYHFPVSRMLMEKGISLFLEKPMGLDTAQCRQLNETAQAHQVRIGVNHNFIFYPLFLRLQKDLADRRIGKPEFVTAFYGGPLGQLDFGKFGHWMFREPGNIILEQGPHPISQVRAILGEVKNLTATVSGRRELGKDQFFYDRWQAAAECENGHAFIHLSFGGEYSSQRSLIVYGRDGSILADFLNNRYLIQTKSAFPDYLDPTANAFRYFRPAFEGVKDFTDYAFSKLKIKDRSDAFFMTMKKSVAAFYEAMTENAPPPCTGEDGMKVIETCGKWIEAAAIPPNPEPKPSVSVGDSDDAEILVTGATGFIGGCLVEKLIAQEKKVRVLVRSPSGLKPALHSPLVSIVRGDLTDEQVIKKAVHGVKHVFHLAHGLGPTWDDFHRMNVEPARQMARACLENRVSRFVFASTIAAFYYGDIPNGIVTAGTPLDTKPDRRNLYARSKIVIENLLLDMEKRLNIPLIIARPGIVVGKNGILNHGGVGQWTRDNVCAYWGYGENELPFVLVEDVADALIRMTETDGVIGKAFNLVGDVRLSAKEYIEILREKTQRNIIAFPYPIPLCFMSETLKFMIKYAAGERGGLLSYRDLANRSVPARFDCGEEKRLLNWTPCSDREKFISKTFDWK